MSSQTQLFLVALLSGSMLWAQAPTGEITGTVSDPKGGRIAGATVIITNSATNLQRTASTNGAGIYTAAALPPGTYSVKANMAGFKSDIRNNIDLQVDQIARLDFTLQVGNVSETVVVEAQAPTLDTENATVGTVVETKRIEDLPLNGRNYLQLASLTPGATQYGPGNSIAQARGGGDRSNFQLNIAGQRLENNHYMLDGVENTDPNYGTYLVQPSVDALQEFKVETSTYSAEYGHNLAQINVITKSGGNEYHGTLFEFLRNSDLDAKNFFDNGGAPNPPFKRNQFGGVIGGPVQIPKVFNGKNKLFFFFNYEGLRQVQAQTIDSTVPLASDRAGNFAGSSTVVYDPATRVLSDDGTKVLSQAAFPGNVIPASRISPVSQTLLQYYPLPNRNVKGYANDFLSNESASANADAETARIDWQQSTNSSFVFRYSHGNEPQYSPAAIPQQGTVNSTITHQALLGHTWVLGPDKVNEFKLGFSRLELVNGNLRTGKDNVVQQLGIPYVLDTPAFWGVPYIQFTGLTAFGDPPNGPYSNWDTIIQPTDNFSWNKGKHSIKFGVEYMRTRFNLTGNDVARGRFTFNGEYTTASGVAPTVQNSVADYLLGYMSESEGQLGEVVAQLRGWYMGLYFQDQWKVTNKLTINYGVRYELQPGYRETHDRLTLIDFAWNNSIAPTWVRLGSGQPYQGNPPYALPSSVPFVRDGRFGDDLNRTDFNNWGPRFGIAYSLDDKTVIRAGGGVFYIHEIGNTMFDTARNMPFTLRIASPSNALTPNETWASPFPVLGISTLAPDWLWKDPTSYVPQWSFTLQRALTKSMSLELGYVGSAGVHLYRTTYYNEPQPGPPTANLNLRRPFPYLGFIQLAAGAAHSSYDALQVRLQQRFSKGFTLLSSFSYEKSIDNGSGIRQANGDEYTPQNVYDLAAERGPSAFNFGKRWVTSFLYELPFGKNKPMLAHATWIVDGALGGWQLGGIFTWQGGFPLSAYCTSGSTYQNTDTPCRADATGISPILGNAAPTEWFNTAAFVNRLNFIPGVGPYTFGNSGRNVLIGPGMVELDASLQKSFFIAERTHLDFRAEFFNLPNHPILGQPGTTVGTPSYGVIGATNLPSREVQFALKLLF
ncbi:MAG TPA: carboxypeptidase regulatory-like domain-containing protein [Bryobacteraceae bacterium]|nr:carboxypeptidase regulatory-like domain-containing protein [Bryobacteraceae bacterium]